MSSEAKLPIYEIFHSWQGEGCHMGRSAFFIRTFGCPIHCPWCDSAGTWHPDHVPERIERVSIGKLVAAAVEAKPDFVVVTGGEPTIHDLRPLTQALHAEKLPVHLETSGAFEIKGDFDWITISPKWQKLPLSENFKHASELKIIVENPQSIQQWQDKLGDVLQSGMPVWLHPEWTQRNNAEVLNAITEAVKQQGHPYRAGWQIHKHYCADATDIRAKLDIGVIVDH